MNQNTASANSPSQPNANVGYPPVATNPRGDVVLVAYVSRCGSTAEIAAAIAEALARAGVAAEARPASEVTSFDPYRAVVIGSCVRAGKWQGEATKLVKRLRAESFSRPVAYFSVGIALKDDTPANREAFAKSVEPASALVQPIDVGLFAGALTYSKMGLPLRLIMTKVMKTPEGDFRDFAAVRAWATDLAGNLNPAHAG